MDRIDIGQAVLCSAVLVVMGALVMWGPTEHRTTTAAALVGLIGVVTAALRGRLVKRDPDSFKDGDK